MGGSMENCRKCNVLFDMRMRNNDENYFYALTCNWNAEWNKGNIKFWFERDYFFLYWIFYLRGYSTQAAETTSLFQIIVETKPTNILNRDLFRLLYKI